MTQEEKQLLLIDLCARLPYGVSVKIFDESVLMEEGNNDKGTLYGKETMSDDCFVIKCKSNDSWIISCEDFKPYLRPIHKLTKEELEELEFLTDNDYVDYCNEHHIDYRNLIPKGLALEAKEGMYKTH